MSFSDGTTLLATVPLDGSGTATLTTSALAPGSHPITATYNGDADFLGAPSAASSETVAQARTEVVLVRIRSTRRRKDIDRPDGRDQAPGPGGGVPTGEVIFELLKNQEEGEGDHARDSGHQRRRGDVDAQGQQVVLTGDHDRLQRRCQRQGERDHHTEAALKLKIGKPTSRAPGEILDQRNRACVGSGSDLSALDGLVAFSPGFEHVRRSQSDGPGHGDTVIELCHLGVTAVRSEAELHSGGLGLFSRTPGGGACSSS